jgi:hypothetical protein
MPIEVKTCPLCGQTDLLELYERETAFDSSYSHFGVAEANCMLHDVFLVDRIERRLMLCRNCGLCFISPTFTGHELNRLYKTARMRDHYALVKTVEPSPAANIDNPESLWNAEEGHSRFIFDQVRIAYARCLKDTTVVDVGG